MTPDEAEAVADAILAKHGAKNAPYRAGVLDFASTVAGRPVNRVKIEASSASVRYHVVMLRAGTFRGVSPPKPIRFTHRVLAQAAESMSGKPFKLNHDSAPAAIAGEVVGVVRDARMSGDSLTGVIELDPKAPKFELAKAWLDSQIALGATPNVSIEGTLKGFDAGDLYEVESVSFTALAGVSRGACSDLAGCGVVAALSRGNTMDTNATNTVAPLTVGTTTFPLIQGTADNTATYSGPVTFTVVSDAEKVEAEKVALAAEKQTLEAKLAAEAAKNADMEKALVAVKAALADSEKALENERAKLPVLVALSALAPAYPTEGKTLCELKAALEMAKLAPAAPGRVTLMAEPVPAPKTHIDLLREKMGLRA